MIILDTSLIIALLKIPDQLDNYEKLVTHPLIVQETISVIPRKCREQRDDCKERMQKTEGFFTIHKPMLQSS